MMLMLSEADVRRCLKMKDCIEINRKALISLVDGQGGIVPTRLGLQYHHNSASSEDWSLFKPASYQSPCNGDTATTVAMGMKIVSVRSNNPSRGLPLVPATILVTDPESGIVDAVLGATYLTGARTASGSALSAELCVKEKDKPHHLVVFGAGLQAECHIDALRCVLPSIHRITIVNRSRDRAEKLAARLTLATEVVESSNRDLVREKVQEADLIVTCTNSQTPLFSGSWLSPRTHIMGVGSFTPTMQEVDEITVNRSRVYMDTVDAASVGDLKHLEGTKHPIITLGDALLDPQRCEDATSFQEVIDCTFYKAVGTAIQDVMTGVMVVNSAREQNIGQHFKMD